MTPATEILEFWFGASEAGSFRQEWFSVDPVFDAEIRSRFLTTHLEAAQGKLDHWLAEAESALSLILIFDQFPRNLFRGSPQMFATDAKALSSARHAIDNAYDQQLIPVRRMFLYMPFMHSEDLNDQQYSVALIQTLSNVGNSLEFAIKHKEAIERFGRFPHRNPILGRTMTPEEQRYLNEGGFSG